MQTLDLTPYKLNRPEKITWRIPGVQNPTVDALELIKSSSQRKFLRTSDAVLAENGITWEIVKLDRKRFVEWLPYYETRMSELEYRVLADEAWYDARIEKGKEVHGMFFYKNGGLVCSGIFVIDGQEKATFAFKASERISLTNKDNSSIGSVIDYFFIREMIKRGIKIISAGRSRNAFGVHNTWGYLEYKLRFGYEPLIGEEVVREITAPLDEDGSVAFFALQEGIIKLFFARPAGLTKNLAALNYLPTTLPFQELVI